MSDLTNAEAQRLLDLGYPTSGAGDYIAYSTNGTSETGIIARTAIGATGYAAATLADPSVKSNANALTSAAATGAGTVTHYSVFSASTGGTQRIVWKALASARTVAIGDTLSWAVGDLDLTLT